MPLTDVIVRNAKSTGKTCKLSDERGLYLEVSPTGSKWWRLKYRFDGKEKRLALGVYPDVGLKDARERREAARKLLANDVEGFGSNRPTDNQVGIGIIPRFANLPMRSRLLTPESWGSSGVWPRR